MKLVFDELPLDSVKLQAPSNSDSKGPVGAAFFAGFNSANLGFGRTWES